MTTHDALVEMLDTTRHDLAAIADSITLADPETERHIRLLSEVADHAACHMRLLQHTHTRSLLEEEER